MKKTLFSLSLLVSVASAPAGTIATPHIAGSMDGWAGPNSWVMTETGVGTDIWTTAFSGLTASTRYEFKVTDGTWDSTIPTQHNSWLYTDGGGNITISYDGNTYADGWSSAADRLGVNVDHGSWTAVGDWQNQVGGVDWTNADPNTAMTPMGGGIYQFTATLTPGNYNWKSVATGSWDSISTERSVNTPNIPFTTDAINNQVVFTVDSLAGTTQTTVIPEPSAALLGALGLLGILRRRR